MTKVSEKVTFEGVLEKEPDNTITLKELYDRLVRLEGRFEERYTRDDRVTDQFRLLAVFIISVEMVNLVFNWLLFSR